MLALYFMVILIYNKLKIYLMEKVLNSLYFVLDDCLELLFKSKVTIYPDF